MNYSFEYIDIILLAMIAGFIFLRLRGILGKKTGFQGKMSTQFEKEFKKFNIKQKPVNQNFDDNAQKNFLKGAKIAYETIITDFSDSDNKLIASKPLPVITIILVTLSSKHLCIKFSTDLFASSRV